MLGEKLEKLKIKIKVRENEAPGNEEKMYNKTFGNIGPILFKLAAVTPKNVGSAQSGLRL